MTNADVLMQVLSEATGKPLPFVRDVLAQCREHLPPALTLDEALPDEVARQLIHNLRGELPEIRSWLATGYRQAVKNLGL